MSWVLFRFYAPTDVGTWLCIVCVLCFLWGVVVEGLVESFGVVPVDSFGGRELDVVEADLMNLFPDVLMTFRVERLP